MKKNKIFLFLMVMAAAIVTFASCKQEVPEAAKEMSVWMGPSGSILSFDNNAKKYIYSYNMSTVEKGTIDAPVLKEGTYTLKPESSSIETRTFVVTKGDDGKFKGQLDKVPGEFILQ